MTWAGGTSAAGASGTATAAALPPVPVDPRRVLAVLAAEGFLTRLGFGMVNFTLPLYALSIGMNVLDVGLLGAVRGVSIVAIKPLMGRLAVRFGTKPVYLGAIAGRVLTSGLFALTSSPIQLFLVRGVHGASVAARDPVAMTMLADHAPEGRLARSFAWYTTAKDVGGALGYSAAGLTLTLSGSNYRIPFLIAMATSAIAWVVVARILPGRRRPIGAPPSAAEIAAANDDGELEGATADLDRPTAAPTTEAPSGPRQSIRRLALFGGLVAATAQMLYGMFPIIATRYAHLSEAETGLILTGSAVVLIVGGPTFGWLSDRFGRRLVLLVRTISNAASSLVFLFVPTFAGVAAGRFLDDAGKAAFRPTWGALVTGEHGETRSAAAIADLDTAYSVGETVGPLLAGWLWASFGLAAMLSARVGLALLTELYGWLMVHDRE